MGYFLSRAFLPKALLELLQLQLQQVLHTVQLAGAYFVYIFDLYTKLTFQEKGLHYE